VAGGKGSTDGFLNCSGCLPNYFLSLYENPTKMNLKIGIRVFICY